MLVLFVNDKWKGIWKEAAVSNLMCYHRIWLGEVMKTAETLVRIAIPQSKIRTQDVLNMKKGRYILE
jgi:hypothetical protein